MIITAVFVLFCAQLSTATSVTTSRRVGKQPLPLVRRPDRIHPLPQCPPVPSIAELRAPGLGIALEMGYGTAVVRQHNGTYQTLMRVDGDEEYMSTMQRLSDEATAGNSQPLDTYNSIVLAKMVTTLHAAAEDVIHQHINRCVISTPDHLRVSGDLLTDVYGHAGLGNSMSGSFPWCISHLSAAYLGLGEGLCSDYLDYEKCEFEEANMPYQLVLHLDLSSVSLTGTILGLNIARGGDPDYSFISSELGLQHELVDAYWTKLGQRIRDLVQELPEWKHIDYLILTGTAASNVNFKSVVRESLRGLIALDSQPYELLEQKSALLDDDDLIFLTARGAAEVAKRRQEGPYMCKDTKEGARRRRDQRPDLQQPMPALLRQGP